MTDPTPRPCVCARDGCDLPATTMVRLRLRPPRDRGNSEIESFLDVILCDDHGATVSAADVITDDAWAKLCGAMAQMGLCAPERGRTAVDAVPLAKAPAHFRARYAAAP